MNTEELIEYLDARRACYLAFYCMNPDSSARFLRSIKKTINGIFIVHVGVDVFFFEDVRSAASCLVQRLGVAA